MRHRLRSVNFKDSAGKEDFIVELMVKNGKKVFVDRKYESKGNRWKMGFRAGKDVMETPRSFVQAWMEEIN